jgi:hypothetical protein
MSFFLIFISFSSPWNLSWIRNLLNPYSIIKKRRGDMGKPYLNPLEGLKISMDEPFTRRDKETYEKHHSI